MSTRSRRRRAPLGLWLWLLLCLGLAVWVRYADPAGDRGIAHLLTALAFALAALVLFPWFVLRSGFSRRSRLGTLVAVVGGAAAFVALVRIEGVSGELVPSLTWRLGGGGDAARLVPSASRASVDLRSTTPFDFPGFLGARRAATVTGVALERDWRRHPPELLWRRAIGAGWSGFAVVNGWAATMEQLCDDEVVSLQSIETGALAWTRGASGHYRHFMGGEGPRSTPTIDGGLVYALGALGRLSCLEGATGRVLWERDLLADQGVTAEEERANVQYGRANSPLVAGERLIVPAGGNPGKRQAGLVAYDKRTGAILWESAPRQVSYSSPVLATLAGVEQVLIVNEDSLSGHDPATGRMLWEHPWPGSSSANASVSQAVPVSQDRVLVSKGYGGGALCLRLVPRDDGSFATEELWRDGRLLRTKFTNVVIHEGFVYGLDDGMLECVALETGERAWKEGRYGHGQILLAGDLLLVLAEEGEVLLVDPRPDRPNEVLGRFQALEGKTWSNPALYRDLLAVRNAEQAAVWRLSLRGEGSADASDLGR